MLFYLLHELFRTQCNNYKHVVEELFGINCNTMYFYFVHKIMLEVRLFLNVCGALYFIWLTLCNSINNHPISSEHFLQDQVKKQNLRISQ